MKQTVVDVVQFYSSSLCACVRFFLSLRCIQPHHAPLEINFYFLVSRCFVFYILLTDLGLDSCCNFLSRTISSLPPSSSSPKKHKPQIHVFLSRRSDFLLLHCIRMLRAFFWSPRWEKECLTQNEEKYKLTLNIGLRWTNAMNSADPSARAACTKDFS